MVKSYLLNKVDVRRGENLKTSSDFSVLNVLIWLFFLVKKYITLSIYELYVKYR